MLCKYRYLFKEALSYDLNTSNALTVLYDLLKDNETNNNTKLELIKEFDTVLSLDLLKDNTNEIDSGLKSYIENKFPIWSRWNQNKQSRWWNDIEYRYVTMDGLCALCSLA